MIYKNRASTTSSVQPEELNVSATLPAGTTVSEAIVQSSNLATASSSSSVPSSTTQAPVGTSSAASTTLSIPLPAAIVPALPPTCTAVSEAIIQPANFPMASSPTTTPPLTTQTPSGPSATPLTTSAPFRLPRIASSLGSSLMPLHSSAHEFRPLEAPQLNPPKPGMDISVFATNIIPPFSHDMLGFPLDSSWSNLETTIQDFGSSTFPLTTASSAPASSFLPELVPGQPLNNTVLNQNTSNPKPGGGEEDEELSDIDEVKDKDKKDSKSRSQKGSMGKQVMVL